MQIFNFAEKCKTNWRKISEILRSERCKSIYNVIHRVDLVKSFPTSIYLQKSASIQPRTSLSKFGGKFNSLFIRLLTRGSSSRTGSVVVKSARSRPRRSRVVQATYCNARYPRCRLPQQKDVATRMCARWNSWDVYHLQPSAVVSLLQSQNVSKCSPKFHDCLNSNIATSCNVRLEFVWF